MCMHIRNLAHTHSHQKCAYTHTHTHTAGFTSFLLGPESDLFNLSHCEVYQDMSQTLSDYHIASSHNTYVASVCVCVCVCVCACVCVCVCVCLACATHNLSRFHGGMQLVDGWRTCVCPYMCVTLYLASLSYFLAYWLMFIYSTGLK